MAVLADCVMHLKAAIIVAAEDCLFIGDSFGNKVHVSHATLALSFYQSYLMLRFILVGLPPF